MKVTHLQELRASGISDAIIELNFKSLEGESIYEKLTIGCDKRLNNGRLPDSWLKRYQHCEAGGWWCNGINLRTGDEQDWGCFKPDNPKIDINKQKPIKYEHPKGVPTDVFALKIDDETAKKISERYKIDFAAENFWDQVFPNQLLPIIFTEGVKKTAALLSAGWISIGLPGIWSGYRKDFKNSHGLHPTLTTFAGHPVWFAFDQDAKPETRQSVKQAITVTAKALGEFGCKCKVISWADDYKGVDDLLIADPELFVAAVRNAKDIDTSSEQAIADQITSLIEQGLSGARLTTSLAQIGKRHGQSNGVIKEIYREILQEQEREEAREENVEELEKIIQANEDSLPLDEIIPEMLAKPITQYAEMLGMKPEIFLTSMLVGLSSLGNPETELVLDAKRFWKVTPGLYGGLVANSSQKKSAVIKAMITSPLGKIQQQEKERFEQEMLEYKAKCQEYDSLKSAKKPEELAEKFPEGEPIKPVRALRYCTDMNGEGLKRQLVETPNQGILALSDELVSLFKAANQYRGGKGSDVEDILSLYDGTGVSILRKTEVTDVGRALFSIFGSTQPDVIKHWMKDGRDASGQWSRFIFVYQPLSPMLFPEGDDDGVKVDIECLMDWVYKEKSLLPAQKYRFNKAAKGLFKSTSNYYEILRVSHGESDWRGNMAGKNPGRIGKLAIILHEIKYICLGQIPPEEIEIDTVRAAVKLTAFYTVQTNYLHGRFSESLDTLAPSLYKILELSKRLGELTPRIVKKYRICDDNSLIVGYFKELQEMGYGVVSEGRTAKFTAKTVAVADKFQNVVAPEKPSPTSDSLKTPQVEEVKQILAQPGDRRISADYGTGTITCVNEKEIRVLFDNYYDIGYPNQESLDAYTKPTQIQLATCGTTPETQTEQAIDGANSICPLPLNSQTLSVGDIAISTHTTQPETVEVEDEDWAEDYPAEDCQGQALLVGSTVKIIKDGSTAVVTEINNPIITLATETGTRKLQSSLLELIDRPSQHTDKSL